MPKRSRERERALLGRGSSEPRVTISAGPKGRGSSTKSAKVVSQGGQLLIEISVAIGIIATLSAMTATLIVVAQRNQVSAQRQDGAASLMSEAYAILRTIAGADSTTTSSGYNRLYCPPSGVCPSAEFPVSTPKGSGFQYRPVLVGSRWELETGSEQVTLGDVVYTRFVTIENVCRDTSGDIVGAWSSTVTADCPNGSADTDDPLAQKLTVTLQAPNMADLSAGVFMTRWRNIVSGQSDWSGGEAEQSAVGESTVHFTIIYTEDNGDQVRGHVCKTPDPPLGQLCPGGSWADSAEWTTVSGGGGTIDLFYTPVPGDIGDYSYYSFICDIAGDCGADGSNPGTFTVN